MHDAAAWLLEGHKPPSPFLELPDLQVLLLDLVDPPLSISSRFCWSTGMVLQNKLESGSRQMAGPTRMLGAMNATLAWTKPFNIFFSIRQGPHSC